MIIDTDQVDNSLKVIGVITTVIAGGILRYFQWKGYITTWLTKLRITLPIATQVDQQDNEKVMEKLMISDEALAEFKKFASDSSGMIDSERLLSVLHDYGRIRSLIILNSRLNQKQKDEACDLLFNIIQTYKK